MDFLRELLNHILARLITEGAQAVGRRIVPLWGKVRTAAWILTFALIAMADASLKPDLNAWQRLAGF